MIQESLKRFWKKTKDKSGAILAGLMVGCTLLCTPYVSVNAGAVGVDELPPFTGGNAYVKNGLFNATYFMSDRVNDPTGEIDSKFFSLCSQDNYTRDEKLQVTYTPNGGAYNRASGEWVIETFNQTSERTDHVLESQMSYTEENNMIAGMVLRETWVEWELFSTFFKMCNITFGGIENGRLMGTLDLTIGGVFTYKGANNEDVNTYPKFYQKSNGSYGLDVNNPWTNTPPTKDIDGNKYVYCKAFTLYISAHVPSAGLYRLRMQSSESVVKVLPLNTYVSNISALHADEFARNNDVGALFTSPVKAFLNTDFLPGFTVGTLLIIAVGIIILGLYLKFALGG